MIVMSRGLYGQKYSGYFADNLTFFDSATKIGSGGVFNSINLGDEGSTYSWKWYGFIIPLTTGTYTFQTISDDASYVYVDETQVVNNGGLHGAQTRTGTINLNVGTRYLIRIYFGENAGAASMIFSWSGGSQTTVTTDLTTDILKFYPNYDIVHRGKNLLQPRDIVFYRIPSEYQNVNQMNADITNITNFGNVIATVSSRQASNRNAAKAFNSNIASGDGWRSAVQYSSGIYTGSASLGGYDGEWIKIQFPTPLFLYSSRIHARPTFIPRLTKTGHIIASNDDINWVRLVDIIRNDGVDVFYSDTSYLTTPYCFYAIVTTSIESTEASVNIGEWFLYTRKIEYNPIDINNGLQVHLDATVGVSYPGSGTAWYDISGKGRHGTWSAAPNYDSDGWFNTNGLECTGPASNSFGITDISGYTIFITWYQYGLTEPVTFQFYRTGTGNETRGIYSHCTWIDTNIYFDQGWTGSTNPRVNAVCPNPTGTWHTTAFVRETNSTTMKIYLDGSLLVSGTGATTNLSLSSTAVNYVGPGGAWNAALRCFIAYNRGLSSIEVTELHNRFRV